MTTRTPRPPPLRCRVALTLALAALLGGCVLPVPYPVYDAPPVYTAAPYPAYAPPPAPGGVYVGGGWGYGYRHWR